MNPMTLPLILLLCAFTPGGFEAASETQVSTAPACANHGVSVSIVAERAVVADGWIADASDNICGLRDPKQLSNPAVVQYPVLWEATPEIKEMKREGIDPDSAEGKRLKQEAEDRIAKLAKKVMKSDSHCSVWKKVSHTDGRTVTDLTEKMKKKLES